MFDSASQYVAGLPLTLEVSSAPIIHPAITGGKQFATGAFTVTYNGSTIDTVNNGSGGASGDLSASATLDQDTGISAAAPVGMQVAYREADCQSSLPGNQPLKLPVGSPPEYVLIP